MYIVVIILAILAGVSEAVMDKINFHFEKSVFKRLNPLFWDSSVSWKNKWKDGDKSKGERFFGSSTFLVFVTDGWHLFKVIHTALFISFVYLVPTWWMLIFCYILKKIVFELFFSIIFAEKK